jgi:hypothetical protein
VNTTADVSAWLILGLNLAPHPSKLELKGRTGHKGGYRMLYTPVAGLGVKASLNRLG